MKYSLPIVLLLLVFVSCVPNRKYVYLQKKDVNVKDLPKDTVLRTYPTQSFDYKIQPNDILYVKFESLSPKEYDFFTTSSPQLGGASISSQANPLLIGELVDGNGTIPFPVLGKVKVAGLTVFQIQDTLQSLAKIYIESPLVKVRLLNFRYTILGEVPNEGTVVLNNNRVTIMEAIGRAGGLTDLADKANIKLIRQKGPETEVQYINLLEEDFINSPYYYVYQNDIIVVPALRQRPYRKYVGQNLSLVASALTLLVLVLNLTK